YLNDTAEFSTLARRRSPKRGAQQTMWRSSSSKREEEQPLTSSSDGRSSSGATATSTSAAAAATDDAPFLLPSGPGPFLRNSITWDRGEQFRSPKQGLSDLFRSIVTSTARPDHGDMLSDPSRGRASTSARPLDERRKHLSVLNFFGLKRRSSLGVGGSSPNELRTGGRGAKAWDGETGPWDFHAADDE
ncbi:unnamed protein product, partial [Laminaria digitata]